MTQAYNLSQLANNLNTSGQLDATDGLVNAVPVANGGTGANNQATARSNLDVPSTSGSGATGTWGINISGTAANASAVTNGVYTTGNQTIGGTKTFTNGITFNDGTNQTTAVIGAIPNQQIFQSSGPFTVPAGVTKVYAYVFGGGGGGTNYNTMLQGGDGGVGVVLVTGLTPGGTVVVTVGAGGRGSDISTNNAAAGGTSSFGTYATATGGGVGNPSTGDPAPNGTFTATAAIISRNSLVTAGGSLGAGGGGGGGGFTGGGGRGDGVSVAGGTSFGPGNAGNNNSGWSGGAGGSPNGGVGGSGNPTFGGGGGGGGGGGVIVRW